MERTLVKRPGFWASNRAQTIALAAGMALLAALAAWMIVSQFKTGLDSGQNARAVSEAVFEQETGLKILRVALVANGGILDLQYQVVDPDKSLAIHDDDNPPLLIDESSHEVVGVPFHEHSFKELHTAVTYHELLMNGGGVLERGDTVSLTIGEARLENIMVQ